MIGTRTSIRGAIAEGTRHDKSDLNMWDEVSLGLDERCTAAELRGNGMTIYPRSVAFNDSFPSTEPIPMGIANGRFGAILLKNSIGAAYFPLSEGFRPGLMSLSYWNY
jgi:hypothetical protein